MSKAPVRSRKIKIKRKTGFRRDEKVINNFEERCFTTMKRTESRLKMLVNIICNKISMKLSGNCFFPKF